MGENYEKLTVFFEEPFWVGVIERVENGKLSAAKITFGAEPRDFEVYGYIEKYYYSLKFSPAVSSIEKNASANPKKQLREIKKQVREKGIGTKSQQALKLLQEQNKEEHKIISREEKALEAQRKFDLKQQKKREKHRGR